MEGSLAATIAAAAMCDGKALATPFDGLSQQHERMVACDASTFPTNKRDEVSTRDDGSVCWVMAETSRGIWMNSYYYLIVAGIAGSVASNRLFRKQRTVKNEDVTVANVTKALTPVGVVFWWLSLAVLVAGVTLSFFSSGGGSSAHNLYDAFKSVNPDSSDVRMKYLGGKVLKECDLGDDQTLDFGWAKIRQVVSTGDMTSAPSDYKIYILTEHFHGNLTTVKFLGRDEVQPMLDYGAMKGCALQLDSE